MKGRALLASILLAAFTQPALAQDDSPYPDFAQPGWDAATLFAVMARNEWCPGGSVTLDLWTGDYVLVPRTQRPDCASPDGSRRAQHGTLPDGDLAQLRSAYRAASSAGLKKTITDDEIIVSNGGRDLLVVTGPNFSLVTPEAAHDWSKEARALHGLMFEIFGTVQTSTPFTDLTGRRTIPPTE